MNEVQKEKRKFRQTKEWLQFKKVMWAKYNKTDAITQKPLRKGANLHHRNLDENQYQDLKEEWFLPCNSLTHKVVHWLWTYYQKDPKIIERLENEMRIMAEINRQN